MVPPQLSAWVRQSPLQYRILVSFNQPLTAKQLCDRESVSLDRVRGVVRIFVRQELLLCLNDDAQRSRVWWLTRIGLQLQTTIRREDELPALNHDLPGAYPGAGVDWSTYGWLCFSHRRAIILALSRPMQPSEIKRRALLNSDSLRMSANNVRDAIRLLVHRGVVRPIKVRKQKHPRYELTEAGEAMRGLLQSAEVRP